MARVRRHPAAHLSALVVALGVVAVSGIVTARALPPVLATSPLGPSLMVTFRAAPTVVAAHAALDAFGVVTPIAPEVGVWAITGRPGVALRERVLARPGVIGAEWSLARRSDDLISQALGPPSPLVPVATPTDTYFASGREWNVLPPATTWGPDLTGTPPRPRIAILDSGVDASHEEWRGPASPLVAPWSAWTSTEQADDWGHTGHGTHVAGTAAAPINGVGVVGVAPGAAGTAEVIPVQISDRDGYSTDITMIKGIRWSVRHGAKVINISAGGPGESVAFQRVINWAFSSGALLVASVGNDGNHEAAVNFPAGYAHVLGVAAQCAGTVWEQCPTAYGLARFSNRNASVDLIAPGVDILSSVPLRVTTNRVAPGYAVKEGTSMAAPFVAGAAALVFAANPGATPYQVMTQLQNTATDIAPAGRDLFSGSGVINPRAATLLPLPPDDPGESNDDSIEVKAATALEVSPAIVIIDAAIDIANDPRDVYPVTLRTGQRVRLVGQVHGGKVRVALWPPGTPTVVGTKARPAARSGVSARPRLSYVPTRSGRWLVTVNAVAGRGWYHLEVGATP
ncbi:MAG: hypothetical protein EXQ74_01020 [Thermoleophilia bacterium]|nr:hypothetical protein [Thermoleophilia bacterium]